MNLQQSKAFKPILACLALVLLSSVFFSQRQLNHARDQMGLTRGEPLENAPPVLAFTTVALGSFRGLIANVLWVRMAEMQENDRFFEMVQLADWITKLQPHFHTVWIHLAWNMSYNISVKFDDWSIRWQWVKRGIELLRDEALRYNPREPLLYRELAWHFQHKVGQNLDDAHNYYKHAWAMEMMDVLGRGQPDWDALINPQTPEQQAAVERLRNVYKMDPAFMKKVDEAWGPLEWKLPESHAIYWAMLGLEKSRSTGREQDLTTLRRVIFQSMQLAFFRGRLVFPDPNGDEFIYSPNVDIVPTVNRSYLQMIEDEPEMKDSIRTGHKNFLKSAVYFLYTHNRLTQAREWFDYLKEEFPNAQHGDAPLPEQSLDAYVFERVASDIAETSHDRVKAMLLGLLNSAYLNLAMGENERAAGYERLARNVRNRFQSQIRGSASEGRVGLPPLDQLKQQVLREMLNPETGLRPGLALRLRSELGLPAEGLPERPPQPEEPAQPTQSNQPPPAPPNQ